MGLGQDLATRHLNVAPSKTSELLSDKVIRLPEHTPTHNLRTPRKILANGLLAARPRRRLGCNVLKFSRTG